jgi:hypothetical protein
MGFATYIIKQKDRDDVCGDFARDFIRVSKAPELHKDVNKLESETLYGFYKHVPFQYRNDDHILDSLTSLWSEYLEYKHIGLKFNEPEIGFMYFLKARGENAFKIGKTKKDPIIRKSQIETTEKIDLYIYNWMKIKHYSIIESELKQSFKKYQIQKEWYQFEHYGVTKDNEEFCLEIREAIKLYSHTDEECVLYKDLYE